MKIKLISIITLLLIGNYIYSQTILYVTKNGNDNNNGLSWESSYATIQKAIDEAAKLSPKGQVWIAQGIYFPTVTTDGSTEENKKAFVLKDGISVYGGFLGNELNLNERVRIDNDVNGTIEQWEFKYSTTLSGDIDGEDDVFVWKENEEWKTPRCEWVVSGTENNCEYTIWPEKNEFENEAIIDGVIISGAKKVGITLYNNILLKNSTIKNNARGGWLKDGGVIRDCSINNNYDTGVFLSDGEVDNCIIFKNTANTGGGVYFSFGGIVKNSIIKENYAVGGGGIEFWGRQHYFTKEIHSGKVIDCIIVNNDAGSGGGISSHDYGIVINSLVANNNGGGVRCELGDKQVANVGIKVTNSTIVNNNEGGIECKFLPGAGVFTNTIIWGNGGNQISGDSEPRISYCAIEGGCSGVENLNLNVSNSHIEGPNFTNIDLGAENWQLLENSPCIDFGNKDLLLSSYSTDLAAQARVQGYEIDLGCYESPYSKGPRPVNLIVNNIDKSSALLSWTDRVIPTTNTWLLNIREEGSDWEQIIINSNPYTLTNLNQAKAYEVKIASIYTENRTSLFSKSEFFITPSVAIVPNTSGVVFVKEVAIGSMNGSSWENATNDIQAAIDAEGAVEIWVASGTYYSSTQRTNDNNDDRYRSFNLKAGIELYGGFIGNETSRSERDFRNNITILNGNLRNSELEKDNSYNVVYYQENTNSEDLTILDGFNIQNGYGENGAGVVLLENGIISNSRIINNSALSSGELKYGGGIKCISGSIRNCIIEENKADRGGGIDLRGESEICNSIIANNVANYQGSNLYIVSSNAPITNCNVISGNILISNYSGKISNSIFWNCSFPWGTPSFEYCAVSNGNNENGNISLSNDNEHPEGPNFIDWENGNYGLLPNSPCINTGNNDLVASENDIDGNQRIIGNNVDIGAYETSYLCEIPGNLEVNHLTRYTGEVSWQAFGGESKWLVSYKNKEYEEWMELQSSTNSLIIEGLEQGETYQVRIAAFCSENEHSLYSDTISFTTIVGPIVPSAEGIVYVKQSPSGTMDGSSWENATFCVQSAIDAPGCKEVWVAEGEYLPRTPTSDQVIAGQYDYTFSPERLKSFQPKNGVKVYGGFKGNEASLMERNVLKNKTVLNGDIGIVNDNSDNSYHVIWFDPSEIIDSTIVDGFYISDGYADGSHLTSPRNDIGGGVLMCINSFINNCVISDNYASSNGGGVNFTEETDPYVYSGEISNSIIAKNTAEYGFGGGLNGIGWIMNCTVVSNVAKYYSGIFNTGNVTNCIVWGNRNTDTNNDNQAFGRNYGNCAVEKNYPDDCIPSNTIILDSDNENTQGPNFISAENVNLNLQLSQISPCIDKGNLNWYDCPEDWPFPNCNPKYEYIKNDLKGERRVIDGFVDIGAFEYNSGTSTYLEKTNDIIDDIYVYPNPSNGVVNVNLPLTKSKISIKLYEINGRFIRLYTLNGLNSKDDMPIDLSDFNNGIYFIKIETQDYQFIQKVVKQ